MKVKGLKMKNKERFVLVNAGWKKLDPKEVSALILVMYLIMCLGGPSCHCFV